MPKLNYTIEGKGFPLVLLHGFCEDLTMWNDFITFFPNHQIIRIDLPGLGKSSPLENQSIESMADAVKKILDKLEISSCILIGHSMGGYVSLAFANKYELVLKGIGLFHSHPFSDTSEKKSARDKAIEFVKRNGPILYVKQLVPKLFDKRFAASNEFTINKLIHAGRHYTREGIIANLEAMRDRPDQSQVLKNLSCPALFIIGKTDAAVPLTYSLEQTYLPERSLIQILPKTGHMGMFEATKKTAKTINQFMDYCLNLKNNQ